VCLADGSHLGHYRVAQHLNLIPDLGPHQRIVTWHRPLMPLSGTATAASIGR
jgi:hypothetical protein